MERVSIHYEPLSDSIVQCEIDVHDESLLNHRAELRIVRKVIVHQGNPVNGSGIVLQRKIARLDKENRIDLHRGNLRIFSYSGPHISIEIHSELRIDNTMFVDTTLSQQEEISLSPRPEISSEAKKIIEPADAFHVMDNLAALPAPSRIAATLLLLLGAIVISINAVVGVHDQFVPEREVWFYDHHRTRGRAEFPLQKSLVTSTLLGTVIWMATRRTLRNYMRFHLHHVPDRIGRGDVIAAGSLVRGRSRVPLENIVVRVVACNMEKGQIRGRKSTVPFSEPVRAVILYEQRIRLVPAWARVESFLTGEVRFEPMFSALYPPQLVGKDHGLAVHWEVQLIHDDFIDQELIGPSDCFPWKDFMAA